MSILKYGLVGVLVAGCGTTTDNRGVDAAGDDDAPPSSSFHIGGTVTGIGGGIGMSLQLDGANDLSIAADGSFEFNVLRDPGATYTVSIQQAPACPQRICTITNAAGTVGNADVSDVTVNCAEPKYRLVSHNWGATEHSLRLTDDVLALADLATATPRVVTGSNAKFITSTNFDSVVFDPKRDLVYAPTRSTSVAAPAPAIQVFANASTTAGNVGAARTIIVAGETDWTGVDIDAEGDRLYVSGASNLYVFDNASTLNGTVTPTATIPISGNAGAISFDSRANRLYVLNQSRSLLSFDNANQLTSASIPTRTLTWNAPNDRPFDLTIDGCHNRLYIGFRNIDANVNLYAFDAASTLTSANAVSLHTIATAQAGVPDNQIMSLRLDSSGHLYFWKDSATVVRIVNHPEALTGTSTIVPDKTINGAVSSSYGIDVMAF